MDVEREDAGVAVGGDGVVLKREGLRGPGLRSDVVELRAGAGEEVVDAGGELDGVGLGGGEELGDGGAGVGLRDDEGVRENRGACAGDLVDDGDGRGHFDAGGHVDEHAVVSEGGVQGAEFIGAEVRVLLVEVAAHEVAVFHEGIAERLDDDTASGKVGGERGVLGEDVVGKHEARGAGQIAGVGRELGGGLSGGGRVAVELDAGAGAEAPGFVADGGQRAGLELGPGGALGVEPPVGQAGLRGEVLREDVGREAAGGREGFWQGGAHR